ncbi:MAG: type I glyceraldehyde-3-phosphate dehydrogenase [Fibrobacteria bacterium]|nr:type I glyceraldehyde-3-phosphate dehydrogenase [Fibrobacteria bacterium]
MTRIGINGFGRIGRNFLRAARGVPGLEVVAVNDLAEAGTLAYLLSRDSILGRYPGTVSQEDGHLVVDGRPVRVFAERDPGAIPWASLGVDLVIESTGRFADKAQAEVHILRGGAKRVLISAPAKGDDLTIVMGVNQHLYDPARHRVVSNGSCTTNALAPLAKVLNDAFGIEHGQMVTTHAYTNSQALHDQPSKELRAGRAAAHSIIPHSTGAAKAIGKVLPELDGRLSGYSLRVPVPVVSVVDLTVQVRAQVDVAMVNAALREASLHGSLAGILGFSEEPLVSSDFQGDPRSSIVDAPSTLVSGGHLVKVLSWYDNEWGFSMRLVDLARHMSDRGL